jgi:two-component system sensor histidine kinase TctE
MVKKPSLRSRVVKHVILPLALTWACGTLVTVGVANYFVQKAFDRSLVDDAYSVAANVKGVGPALALTLSSREINHVLFDQSEAMFFAVLRTDGSLVAGHPGLRPVEVTGTAPYALADIAFQGKPMRSVSLQRDAQAGFQVVMAQTQLSRDTMLQRLLVLSTAPQLILLILLGLWLRRAITADLAPLAHLQTDVDRRPAHDFKPFSTEASTRDLDRLAHSLNALLGRIQTSVQAQREFAGNVAHELRTPLAGIRALAEYGLAARDPVVWQQQLQSVLHSEARATHMVDQLLALALADEAGAAMQLEPVALDESVRQAVLRYLPRADALGVDLGARGIDEPLTVMGHPILIDGMLNNLIDNALRYGKPAGDLPARVTVAAERVPGQLTSAAQDVRLAVIDNGPGLSRSQQDSVAQRWVRGNQSTRLAEGAGLGLAIVTQYARSMGAEVQLSAGDEGQGLNVAVRFTKPV